MSRTIHVPTSAEVWAVIKARHPELVVFSSYSDPDDKHAIGTCTMRTSYGFNHCRDYPIISTETTWEKSDKNDGERVNEKHSYWLCVGEDDNDCYYS